MLSVSGKSEKWSNQNKKPGSEFQIQFQFYHYENELVLRIQLSSVLTNTSTIFYTQ